MISRGIDVGYGDTKYIQSISEDGVPICAAFPSIAPAAADQQIFTGMKDNRSFVRVEVDGHFYEVGPDAYMSKRLRNTRTLSEDYAESSTYMALMLGALSYMDVRQIDLLVVGLPVSYVNARAPKLIERLKGRHKIANGEHVQIDDVWVLAQPLGGFMDFALQTGDDEEYNRLRQDVCLTIDVGYNTLDWLVSNGLKYIKSRSGSCATGVSSVVTAIAERISAELKETYNDYFAISSGLSGKREFKIKGVPTDITKYVSAGAPAIDEGLGEMLSSIGDPNDIEHIILVGGGAVHYLDAVRKRFPRHNVSVSTNPEFAVVRGLQYAGDIRMKNETSRRDSA